MSTEDLTRDLARAFADSDTTWAACTTGWLPGRSGTASWMSPTASWTARSARCCWPLPDKA